ncbi:MAG TPA: hypothetical protein VKX17_23800 [Planctomycetota bacterium]|nr:hypothetical protein [Planctomycetota bacterium]
MSVVSLNRFFSVTILLAFTAFGAHAETPKPSFAYGWKPGEVYRYDYSKLIHIVETSTDTDPGTRDFGFEAVLILEVTGKAANGVKAVLRFDSPKLTIPDEYQFLAPADDPSVQLDKAKTVARTMEGVIKVARWNVVLDPSGVIHIDSRIPKTMDDWLKEVEHAAFWRNKLRKMWTELVEQNLGLVASGDDADVLLTIGAPPLTNGPEAAKIRPIRSPAAFVATKEEKSDYTFQRVAPSAAGQPYIIPNVGPPAVTMTLNPAVKTLKGAAVFDAKLAVLDSLSDEYAFELDYACNGDAQKIYKLHQEVTVKYSLIRRSKHKPPDEVDAR